MGLLDQYSPLDALIPPGGPADMEKWLQDQTQVQWPEGAPTPPGQMPDPRNALAAPQGGGGGVMDTLFPAGGFDQMLDPKAIKAAQMQALFRAGLSLLGAGSGSRPVGTRNFGEDLLKAFDPTAMRQGLGQQVQLAQMRGTMETAQKRQQIMSENPPPGAGATPQQIRTWVAQVVPKLISAGLTEDASKLGGILSSLKDASPPADRIHIITDPKQQRVYAIDTASGEELWSKPFGADGDPTKNLDPNQVATLRRQYRGDAVKELEPYQTARESYRTYQALPPEGRQAGLQALALAQDIIHPDNKVSAAQLETDPNLLAAIAKAFHIDVSMKDGLSPADRQQLNALVRTAAAQRAQESHHIAQQHRDFGQGTFGEPVDYVDDPWADFQSGAPTTTPTSGPQFQLPGPGGVSPAIRNYFRRRQP